MTEIWSDNEEVNINCLGCSSSNKRKCKYFLVVCICLKKLMARFCQSVIYFAGFQCFMCMKSFKELISPRTGTFLRSDSVDIISLVPGTFPVYNLFALWILKKKISLLNVLCCCWGTWKILGQWPSPLGWFRSQWQVSPLS